MVDEEETFKNMKQSKGIVSSVDIGRYFAEIGKELFFQLGIDLYEHGNENDSYDFKIDSIGKYLEIKESANSTFKISDKEKDNDYFFGFIRFYSTDYSKFKYCFLTKDELKNYELTNRYKNGSEKQITIRNADMLTFDEAVSKIKSEMERIGFRTYDSMTADEFYDSIEDDEEDDDE